MSAVPARVNVVTLGIADLQRATDFYLRLGWRRSSASSDQISFFDLGGTVLGLYLRKALADDAHLPAEHVDRFGGSTLTGQRRTPTTAASVSDTRTSVATR